MSPALKMGFELLRPWGVISSVGVHNAEVRPKKDHLTSSMHSTDALQIPWYWGTTSLTISAMGGMADDSIGLAIKPMARICVFRWGDARCDQYFLRLWIC